MSLGIKISLLDPLVDALTAASYVPIAQGGHSYKFVPGTAALLNAGVASGAATLDSTGKITPTQLRTGVANGLATLDSNGKLASAQIPAISITDTFVVATQVDMLALTAQTGDVAIRTDLPATFILKGASSSTLADWQQLPIPTDTVLSVDGQTGTVNLTDIYVKAYAATHTYGLYGVCFYDGISYRSLQAGNTGHTPTATLGVWWESTQGTILTSDQIGAINSALTPSASNPFVVQSQMNALASVSYGLASFSPALSDSLGLTKKTVGTLKRYCDLSTKQQNLNTGGFLYVVNATASTIDKINPTTGEVVTQIAVGAVPAKIVTDDTNIFVLCTTAPVKKIILATNAVSTLYTPATGNVATQIAVGGGYLCIGALTNIHTAGVSATLVRIDTSTGTFSPFNQTVAIYGLAYKGGYLAVHYGTNIIRYTVSTVAQYGNIYSGVTTSADSTRSTLWSEVASSDKWHFEVSIGTRYVFDNATTTVLVLDVALPTPKMIYVGGYLWIIDPSTNRLYQINTNTGLIMNRIGLGGSIHDIITDGTNLYFILWSASVATYQLCRVTFTSTTLTLDGTWFPVFAIIPTSITMCGVDTMLVTFSTTQFVARLTISTGVVAACSGISASPEVALFDGTYTYVHVANTLYRCNLSAGTAFSLFLTTSKTGMVFAFFDGVFVHLAGTTSFTDTAICRDDTTNVTTSAALGTANVYLASGKYIYNLSASQIKRFNLTDGYISGVLPGTATATHQTGVYTGDAIWTWASDNYLRRFNE